MFGHLFLILPILLNLPGLQLKWVNPKQDTFKVSVDSVDPDWNKCIESGLEGRYRIEIKVCKVDKFWMDHCTKKPHIETRSLQKNPISSDYVVTHDAFDDGVDPEVQNVETRDEAQSLLTSSRNIDFNKMISGDEKFASRDGIYLSVRLLSSCRGEVSPLIRRVAQVLTLGLLDIQTKDSGWVRYDLNK